MGTRLRTGWRQAVGWIAAYALAVQVIAAGIGFVQATAASLDSSTVICHTGHAGVASEQGPGTGGTCCPACGECALCGFFAPSLAAPDVAAICALAPTRSVLLAPVAALFLPSGIAAHPAQARAPPAAV